jgi:hypothetical protein
VFILQQTKYTIHESNQKYFENTQINLGRLQPWVRACDRDDSTGFDRMKKVKELGVGFIGKGEEREGRPGKWRDASAVLHGHQWRCRFLLVMGRGGMRGGRNGCMKSINHRK